MTLKTLKDFEGLCNSKGEKFILFCLKQEAIKWVKKKRNDVRRGIINNSINFQKFFNITKKDLK